MSLSEFPDMIQGVKFESNVPANTTNVPMPLAVTVLVQ